MKQQIISRPDFIIIGGMKCATSTLHDQLNEYDSFFMTKPKEPNFFSNDVQFTKGVNWYESLFSTATPGQLKGESSTHYTKLPTYPKTVERLASFCPDAKFIYIMRHPIDRLVSHFIHEWTLGGVSRDINTAVEQVPELVEYGRYAMQLRPFLSTFGSSAILPIFFERLKDNPVSEVDRIFKFLGVDEKPRWNNEIKSNVSSKRLRDSKWRDTIVNNVVLESIRRKIVPKKIRNSVKSIWIMKERPVLSADMYRLVENRFDQDLKELGSFLGFELTCCNYNEKITGQQSINWCV